MKTIARWTTLLLAGAGFLMTLTAQAAPCLIVTITGAGGGPPNFGGLAGPGTLVRYGDDSNDCNDDDPGCLTQGRGNAAPAGSIAPPKNGLFTDGTVPQVKSN